MVTDQIMQGLFLVLNLNTMLIRNNDPVKRGY